VLNDYYYITGYIYWLKPETPAKVVIRPFIPDAEGCPARTNSRFLKGTQDLVFAANFMHRRVEEGAFRTTKEKLTFDEDYYRTRCLLPVEIGFIEVVYCCINYMFTILLYF
jgi:hypothetical protein